MFGIKGSTVGDYTPAHTSPSHTSSTLTASVSARDLTKMDYTGATKVTLRSMSLSPMASHRRTSVPDEIYVGRGESGGHIVRVAVENESYCMYKSLLVSGQLTCWLGYTAILVLCVCTTSSETLLYLTIFVTVKVQIE